MTCSNPPFPSYKSLLNDGKNKKLVKLVENEGWIYIKTKSNHLKYKHSKIQEIITIPRHLKMNIVRNTCRSLTAAREANIENIVVECVVCVVKKKKKKKKNNKRPKTRLKKKKKKK